MPTLMVLRHFEDFGHQLGSIQTTSTKIRELIRGPHVFFA